MVANGEQASVRTVEVTVPNHWQAGDQLKVVLSAGVVFDWLYLVRMRGPTTQTSILGDREGQVVPQAGVRVPARPADPV